MVEDRSQDVRSFVTFALAMKPAVTIRRREDAHGPSITLTISVDESLSEAEIASLEPLMAKYRPLKSHLHAILQGHMDSYESVRACGPRTTFEADMDYRLVRITSDQYRIAQEVAGRLERIDAAHSAGELAEAKRAHDEFHEYLAGERAAMVGDFQGIRFSNAEVASFGADRLVAVDDDCSGVVVFVVIEIFIG